MSLAERLRYARERVGMTLLQVKERSDVGQSSLSEYENGQREPSFAQLDRLARLYGRTTAFFFEPGPVCEASVLWRHAPPSPAREETEARFLELCRQYGRVEGLTGESRLPGLPRYAGADLDVSAMARRFRLEMNLGERPALTLLPILEDVAGVKVFHLPLGGGRNAASAVGPEAGQAVLLDSEDGPRERAFSLAHEAYHLLTWGDTDSGPEQEARAEQFAVELLVPEGPFRAALRGPIRHKRVSACDFESLTRQFAVPVGAIARAVVRLVGREIEGAVPALADVGPPPPERPARFVELTVRAHRQGDLSLGKLAEFLGITRYEAMKRFQSERAPPRDGFPLP